MNLEEPSFLRGLIFFVLLWVFFGSVSWIRYEDFEAAEKLWVLGLFAGFYTPVSVLGFVIAYFGASLEDANELRRD